jgi:CubicO group peptidase (beta-lactamase class C family)
MSQNKRHRVPAIYIALLAICLSLASSSAPADDSTWTQPPAANNAGEFTFGFFDPASQNLDTSTLIDLTRWVQQHSNIPIFSILISRNGKIVYELYTSGIDRDQAHYMMSVTKTFVSALVGVAIDHHVLTSPQESLADALPASLFPNTAARWRFNSVTLRDVLGMSALDAPIYPHLDTVEAKKRDTDFFKSPNRVAFALQQKLLRRPGFDFQYTDVTPPLAAGAVEYNAKTTLLQLANQTLFGPMDFKNQEWMHEDKAGIDNASYGLRVRPVDMQKFGLLFLNNGRWEGKQLLSSAWVATSFTPWISTDARQSVPNYGWYWWQQIFGRNWVAHFANGWRGQRIAVFPDQHLVFTMTGDIEDGSEYELFTSLITNFVMPAVNRGYRAGTDRNAPALNQQLQSLLETVRTGPTRIKPNTEPRMIPSANHKDRHHPLRPLENADSSQQP